MNGLKAMEGSDEKDKFSDLREEEIQRQLKQLNKTPVKSFHVYIHLHKFIFPPK